MTKASQFHEPIKLAISMVLLYWLALWMDWDMPKYGALAIALVSLGTAGASFQKGMLRIVGTTAGLAVGMLGLALVAQDRWLTLLFHAGYLVIVGYFMPTSRYGYAWFVAGFLPSLVWASTYGKVDNFFHYASFRYLETSAGITIYTLISVLLWPRRAGDALGQQGRDFWPGLRELFGLYRGQAHDGVPPVEASELRTRLAGAMAKMWATLEAAYGDTPAIKARRRSWEDLRVTTRAFADAMELWRESIEDCRQLDRKRLLPGFESAMDTIDERLARIGDLWQVQAGGADVEHDDRSLLAPLELDADHAAMTDLTHFERAALLGSVQQLQLLDFTSRSLLRTMRDLAGLDVARDVESTELPRDLYRPSRWDSLRLINALFPALCFAAAYVFWIYMDPPTGPSVPNMAATFSLVVLLTPMNILKLLPPMVGIMWCIVAPVYFLVMPRLDGGTELLALIFVYTLVAGLLSARFPMVKLLMLVLFVMMVNVSNEQVYSFPGLVDAGCMFVLSIGIIGVVQMLMTPMRPEHVMLSGLRRFFRGCARITGEFAGSRSDAAARERAARKRYFESMVLPVPARLRQVEKKLDYTMLPGTGPENVNRLLDALQGITLRLQALELAQDRVARHAGTWGEQLVALGAQLRERVQGVFETWSRLEPVDEAYEGTAVRELARGLETQLDRASHLDDDVLADLYTVLGCARGLVEAVAETQAAMRPIDWDRLAEARFSV